MSVCLPLREKPASWGEEALFYGVTSWICPSNFKQQNFLVRGLSNLSWVIYKLVTSLFLGQLGCIYHLGMGLGNAIYSYNPYLSSEAQAKRVALAWEHALMGLVDGTLVTGLMFSPSLRFPNGNVLIEGSRRTLPPQQTVPHLVEHQAYEEYWNPATSAYRGYTGALRYYLNRNQKNRNRGIIQYETQILNQYVYSDFTRVQYTFYEEAKDVLPSNDEALLQRTRATTLAFGREEFGTLHLWPKSPQFLETPKLLPNLQSIPSYSIPWKAAAFIIAGIACAIFVVFSFCFYYSIFKTSFSLSAVPTAWFSLSYPLNLVGISGVLAAFKKASNEYQKNRGAAEFLAGKKAQANNSFDEMVYWHTKAALHGYTPAQTELGLFKLFQNKMSEALDLFYVAASNGDNEAAEYLNLALDPSRGHLLIPANVRKEDRYQTILPQNEQGNPDVGLVLSRIGAQRLVFAELRVQCGEPI